MNASIKGYSVKSLKMFRGMEGDAFQGNLYLNNKKIGFWSQDANGAICDYFELNPDCEQRLEEVAKEYLISKNSYGELEEGIEKEIFMSDLLELTLRFKDYKKIVKKLDTPNIAFVSHEKRWKEIIIGLKNLQDKKDTGAIQYCKSCYIKETMDDFLERIKSLSKEKSDKITTKEMEYIKCDIYSSEEDFVIM